jgi:hypothetical protein
MTSSFEFRGVAPKKLPEEWYDKVDLTSPKAEFIDDLTQRMVRNIVILFRRSDSLQSGTTFSLSKFKESLSNDEEILTALEDLDKIAEVGYVVKDGENYTFKQFLIDQLSDLIV